MTLEERLRELHSVNMQLSWLTQDIGVGLPTVEQERERKRLTKLSEELTAQIPVMFGSQS